jgi:hypothetical protein
MSHTVCLRSTICFGQIWQQQQQHHVQLPRLAEWLTAVDLCLLLLPVVQVDDEEIDDDVTAVVSR